MLSRVRNVKYSIDDVFLPVTTLHGEDIPSYGLFFYTPAEYQATDFAFDNCSDFDQLIPEQVDRNFLISRYERLFEFQGGTAQDPAPTNAYYLVPWMGIPYTDVSGSHHFSKNDFVLEVRSNSIYAAPLYPPIPPPTEPSRKLRLIASRDTITVIWDRQQDALNDKNIIQGGISNFNEKILITVPDGTYTEIGEYIQIEDIIEKKIVGRLRLIFLKKIVQKVFLINVTRTPEHRFRFTIAKETLPPEALQSLESDDGAQHARLIDDAGKYGFAQIGIELADQSALVDLYVTDSSNKVVPFSSLDISPGKIGRQEVTSPSDADYYATLFVDRVRYAQSRQDPTVTYDRYSIIYIFVTRFQPYVKDPVRWVTGETTIGFIALGLRKPKLANTNYRVKLVQPIALSLVAGMGAGLTKDKDKMAHRDHLYSVLCHELMHALSVAHTFRDNNTDDMRKSLSVYVNYPYHDIKIKDLIYSLPAETANRRLFDEIIRLGMNKAIANFIDHIFRPDGPPPQWRQYTVESIGDLLVWLTLEFLVSFPQSETRNIMDYLDDRRNNKGSKLLSGPVISSSNDEMFYSRRIVWINRFQWELARKAVAYFDALPPPEITPQ
jgi:hypothetical protein